MIKAIYTGRRFVVNDAGQKSKWHKQAYGISQGCPLSPYLFVIVMSILMADAKADLEQKGVTLDDNCLVNELVYADDTLLIDVDADALLHFMASVGAAGRHYGLVFNWSKLELLRVRHDGHISLPSGKRVKEKDSMVYLG